MGILRGLGKFFGSLFFSTFLIATLLLVAFAQLTEYGKLKSLAVPLMESVFTQQLGSQMTNENLNTFHSMLIQTCQGKDSIEIPLGESNITVSCTKITGTTSDKLIALIATSIAEKKFDEIYYKNYTCDFLACIQQGGQKSLIVILSQHANNFFKSVMSYSIIGVISGAILIFISSETWSGKLKIYGWNMFFTGGPIILIDYLKDILISKFATQIPNEIKGAVGNIVGKTLEPLITYSIIILVAGVVLIIIGYFLAKKERKVERGKSKSS